MVKIRTFVLLAAMLVCCCQSRGLTSHDVGGSLQTRNETDVEDRFNALEEQVLELKTLLKRRSLPQYTTAGGLPRDCEEIYNNGTVVDGTYVISPDGRCPFYVYCDMSGGGWTVIQKRVDGHVSFYRPWNKYVEGFGELDGSHWLGLEKIHRLTKDGSQVYFELNNWDGSTDFAQYNVFTVHDSTTMYQMNVDAFGYQGSIAELFTYHNNRPFSTYDRDGDASTNNCAAGNEGAGWWYNNCVRLGIVNGIYGKNTSGGIGYWTSANVPLKTTTVKVKQTLGYC